MRQLLFFGYIFELFSSACSGFAVVFAEDVPDVPSTDVAPGMSSPSL